VFILLYLVRSVVCPSAGVMSHRQAELRKFSPDLKVHIYYGKDPEEGNMGFVSHVLHKYERNRPDPKIISCQHVVVSSLYILSVKINALTRNPSCAVGDISSNSASTSVLISTSGGLTQPQSLLLSPFPCRILSDYLGYV